MLTTAIAVDVHDNRAVSQIITSLDPSSPLRKRLELLQVPGRDSAARLVGVAEGWLLQERHTNGHMVYHWFGTEGGGHAVLDERAASALVGGAL